MTAVGREIIRKPKENDMTRLEQLSRELVDVVVNLGYPAEL